MTTTNWEKPISNVSQSKGNSERWKFLVGGLLILGAVFYLIASGTATGARFFITVEDLLSNADYQGETVRISGAVLGPSIDYTVSEDGTSSTITFVISNIPDEFDDLAQVLNESVNNPDAPRVTVVVKDQPLPDLLQHEAQAIVTGELGEDGIFYANELLLKCPSRYQEAAPDQSVDEGGEL